MARRHGASCRPGGTVDTDPSTNCYPRMPSSRLGTGSAPAWRLVSCRSRERLKADKWPQAPLRAWGTTCARSRQCNPADVGTLCLQTGKILCALRPNPCENSFEKDYSGKVILHQCPHFYLSAGQLSLLLTSLTPNMFIGITEFLLPTWRRYCFFPRAGEAVFGCAPAACRCRSGEDEPRC